MRHLPIKKPPTMSAVRGCSKIIKTNDPADIAINSTPKTT